MIINKARQQIAQAAKSLAQQAQKSMASNHFYYLNSKYS